MPNGLMSWHRTGLSVFAFFGAACTALTKVSEGKKNVELVLFGVLRENGTGHAPKGAGFAKAAGACGRTFGNRGW